MARQRVTNVMAKSAALGAIGEDSKWKPEGQSSFRFPQGLVHTRFKTSGPFSFNLNPATLRADYELWICGDPKVYYLLPITRIREMYHHPDAYIDNHHP